jgi:hypothetical protein
MPMPSAVAFFMCFDEKYAQFTKPRRVLLSGPIFCTRRTRYRSLSEVARKITGTRWSGPRFFGLRARAKGSDHGTR